MKQKQKWCKGCRANRLHVASVNKQDMGCGFVCANLLLSVITLGLWLPVFILILSLGLFGNSISSLAPKYHCQMCGRKN